MTSGPLVLHLNGAPGVGKSTLARLWADRHPGTLLLSVLVGAPDPAARFAARPIDAAYLEAVHSLVAAAPADHLTTYAERLAALPHDLVLATEDGEVEAGYERLAAAVSVGGAG